MATIAGTQSITIGTEGLSFQNAWAPKYANELKKGNTTVKRDQMATAGIATLRISHQVSKGVAGHVVSLEVEGARGADLENRLVKAQLVLTDISGDVDEDALLTSVVAALCTYVPTVMADVLENRVD